MKRCPECRRDYYDDTLLYCLDDGNALLEGTATAEEAATAMLANLPGEAPTRAYDSGLQKADDRTFVRHKKNVLVAAALGLAMIVIVVGGYYYYGRNSAKQIDSIAVMPFVNESGNVDVEYLSDGMTETLIGSLQQIPGLNVKARSSVFRYKGKDAKAPDIGKELDVDAILNGRIVQRGSEVILYVELVDAKSENSLWKQTYNKVTANLVALQNEIARDVAEKLQVKLSGADEKKLSRRYTQNAEANRLYLLGRYHWNKRTKSDLYKAIEFFDQAVRLDSNYALAYAGLADAYSNLQGYDRSISIRENSLKAREYALKALSIDESLAEAHVSLAVILANRDHDFAGAERAFKRAIDLDPTYATGYSNYASLLTSFGRFEESDANMKRALELEPASLPINRSYGILLLIARRYEESEVQLKKAVDLDPGFYLTYNTLAGLYMLQGRYAECVEAYARSREVTGKPEAAAGMRASFARGGFEGFFRDLAANTWPSDSWPTYIQAALWLRLGERDRAIASLEEAYEDRESFIVLLNVDPRFDQLRDDPGFKSLVAKVGLK